MKILMLGTLTNSMNGSARSFVRLCNALAAKHEVYVVMPDKEGVAKTLSDKASGVIIEALTPIRRSLQAGIDLPFSMFRLWRVLRTVKPDVVHINDIPWFYGVLICKLMHIPVAIHSRFYEKNKIVKGIIAAVIKTADLVIYVSEFNRDLWGIKKGCHLTLHNPGVFQFHFEDDLQLPDRYALVVSRISEEKGVAEAIRAFSLIAEQDKEIRLVVAGDALYKYQVEYKKKCQELSASLGIGDKIIWLGHVSKPHSLYVKAALYIHLPNFEDPFPTTIMEALALGCRILTNGRGGIREQVLGFDGVCIIEGSENYGQIGARLVTFMNTTHDRYDRTMLYKERFDEERFYEKFDRVLTSLVLSN